MNNTLVISDVQNKVLLDFYQGKINEINDILFSFLAQKSEYEEVVSQLVNNSTSSIAFPSIIKSFTVSENLFGGALSDYNDNWSIPKKALFILFKEHKELSTSKIFQLLLTYEPTLLPKREITMVLLSSGLKDKIDKSVYRVGEKRGEFKYGLLEWK